LAHGNPAATEGSDIKSRLIVLYGLVFTVIVVVLLVWLRDYFFVVRNETVQRNVLEPPNPKLLELRAMEGATLDHYGWVDKEKGIVRVPIARAMELLVRERRTLRRGSPAGRKEAPIVRGLPGLGLQAGLWQASSLPHVSALAAVPPSPRRKAPGDRALPWPGASPAWRIEITDKSGSRSGDVTFVDEAGHQSRSGISAGSGGRSVSSSVQCPMLYHLVLNGYVAGARSIDWVPGGSTRWSQ
jgi:hypothetical protein